MTTTDRTTTTYLHALIEQLEDGAALDQTVDLVRETFSEAAQQVESNNHEVLVWRLVLLWVGQVRLRKKRKGVFLYSAVSSLLDDSNGFNSSYPGRPVHSDTNSASPGSILACSNFAQRLITHISTTVYSQVLIYTAHWTEVSWRERKYPNFETVAKGFEPGLSRLRVPHSTALHVSHDIN